MPNGSGRLFPNPSPARFKSFEMFLLPVIVIGVTVCQCMIDNFVEEMAGAASGRREGAMGLRAHSVSQSRMGRR